MMDPFESYSKYVALKNHFTQKKYDYFKYNGKARLKKDSFEKRNDKVFFQKLSKHKDVEGFLVANLLRNNKSWIKDLVYSQEAEKKYKEWSKKQQSLSYILTQDLKKLDEDFNSNFTLENNQHPKILKLFLGDHISLESFCILLTLTDCKKYFDKHLEGDYVWSDVSFKVEKYTPFINYDKDKIKKIVLDFYS